MSICPANEESIFHTKLLDLSYPNISGICIVALTYLTSCLSLLQSQVFDFFTCLYRKVTATGISGLALFVAYRNLATVLWYGLLDPCSGEEDCLLEIGTLL